jgi:hypothetical protein
MYLDDDVRRKSIMSRFRLYGSILYVLGLVLELINNHKILLVKLIRSESVFDVLGLGNSSSIISCYFVSSIYA